MVALGTYWKMEGSDGRSRQLVKQARHQIKGTWLAALLAALLPSAQAVAFPANQSVHAAYYL
jgi:hypothetical protein